MLTQAQVIEIKCNDSDLVYPTINIILKLKDGVPTNGFDWIRYCLENGNFFLMGLRIGRKEGKKGEKGGGGGVWTGENRNKDTNCPDTFGSTCV